MATKKILNPPVDCISRVRFAPQRGSSHLLVSSWDTHVRLYDVSSGMLAGLHKHSLPVLDCSFLQDSSKAVSVGLDRRVVCIDFQSRQEFSLGQHDEAVRCVEYNASTGQVMTGSWDRTLRLWDLRQPGPLQVVGVGTKVFALDVGVNQVTMAGADRCIHIYDTRRFGAALEKRESGLKHQLRCVKVGIDQRSYASGSVEGRVALEYFGEQENNQLKYAFKCHREKNAAGEEVIHPVNGISFHPVHGTFATGGSDGGVCVWDGYAKKRLWRLNPFDASVSSLCFSADGSMLAVAVSDTFDQGERATPAPELVIRQIDDAEVRPKGKQ